MNDADVLDILTRAGIAPKREIHKVEGTRIVERGKGQRPIVELKVRQLDKFESTIADIGIRLVKDEDYDPQTAGMDVLDAINDKMMTESWERRAGMDTYDAYTRALEILENDLPEDVFADMKARMASQADEYLKSRDSSLSMADTEKGAAPQEQPQANTMLGQVAQELDQIRRKAIRDNYTLGREDLARLAEIIKSLSQQDAQAKGGVGMRLRNLLSRRRNESIQRGRQRAIVEMCTEYMDDTDRNGLPDDVDAGMQEFRSIMSDFHELEDALRDRGDSGIAEQIEQYLHRLWDWYDMARTKVAQDYSEDIQEIRRLSGLTEEDMDFHTLMATHRHMMGNILPQLREIAKWGTKNREMRDKLMQIADRLAEWQMKLHGQGERQSGQMWTDVESGVPAWRGR